MSVILFDLNNKSEDSYILIKLWEKILKVYGLILKFTNLILVDALYSKN